jgi:cellulose synthase/poly-beta-1,6-N-acetylglucosamine synthase-like glycosyltransferase
MVNWRLDQGHMQQASDPANAINSVKEGVQFLYHLGTIDRDRNISLSTPLLVIGIIGLLYVLIRRDSRYLSLMIMGSIALVAAYVPVKWDRYVLPAIPLLGILFGAGIYAITELRKVKLSTIFMGVIATLIMASVVWAAKFLPASEAFIFGITTLLTVQGAIVTTAMLYGFTHKNDDATEANHIEASQKSFTLILPVRNEASVIRATIAAMDRINYPKDLYEVLITVRSDDFETIRAINAAFETIKPVNMRTIIIGSAAQTKAHSLNTALSQTKGEIIGVFDAEDEPQPDLLERINQELDIHPQYAAVQAPVQLVNLNSSWYSTLNSLEYYFWFQSVLPFLSQNGLTPLGGNTIFINKNILEEMDGWDEKCLTEDADMGIRLSQAGYSVGVVTDLELATREEAPLDELGVIKQRSRWDQGYLQVLGKGNWKSLPLKQKILAIYTLTQPIFRHIAFLNMFIAPILGIVLHVSTAIALISFIPSYFLLMQWGMYLIGLKELSKKFAIRVSPFKYIATILFFYPYQALLSLATFRAIGKLLTGNNVWDKTLHYNAHRPALAVSPAPSYT